MKKHFPVTFLMTAVLMLMAVKAGNLHADPARIDTLATISSFTQLGEFYTIDYTGDYQYLLDLLDNLYLNSPGGSYERFGCSLYSGLGDSQNIFYGRNFDNPQCNALVGRYSAPDCYESIALNRLADVGLPVGTDFTSLTGSQQLLLLRSPYFAADGLNSMGVAAGLAYLPYVPVQVDPAKQTIWLTRWVREILDHAADLDEAIAITNSYNIVDNFSGPNTLCHHLLVADAAGNSAVLEYHDGQFMVIEPMEPWQIITNIPIYNVPLQQLFNQCWRYQILYNALGVQNGDVYDWRNGMDILSLPTWGNLTNGSQWSDLFDLNERAVYISLYRDFDNIARVDVENFVFLNFGNFYLDELFFQEENGNGLIEPGEWVYFATAISADFLSTGVFCQLSCDTPGLEISPAEFTFGDIQPEQPVSNLPELFCFTVPENISSQQIDILLHLTTDYGYEYDLQIPFEISGVGAEDDMVNQASIYIRNYPNPFNPATTIHFTLAEASAPAELVIFNLKGQLVKSYSLNPSAHEPLNSISWDGTDNENRPVSSGIYYSVLQQERKILASAKMILLR